MKKTVFFILFLAVLLTGTAVFADYKIILKNGREFIVDDYKDADGKIRFYKMGGEIEIDKGNIESIKEIKGFRKAEDVDTPETVKKDAPAEKVQTEKPDEAGTKNQGTLDRLKELAKKRETMKAEGEKLSEEREKLIDDRNSKRMMLTIHQDNEYVTKATEFEERIKKFNDALSRLEQEIEVLAKEADIKIKKQ